MYGYRENERLYLPAWEYNVARTLGEVAEIVRDRGGKVKKTCHIMANNRSYEPDAEPRQIYGSLQITFTLDENYYSFWVNENPLFEYHYIKTPIKNGKHLRNVYAEELFRTWAHDCLFRVATDIQIHVCALELLDLLTGAHLSQKYNEKHKIAVPNTYDGGYHFEYKYDPDEWVSAEV